MSALAVPDTLLDAPISPELVLVASPEVASYERSLLAPAPWRSFTPTEPTRRDAQPGQAELAMVWLFCIAMTLGPLLFILIARP